MTSLSLDGDLYQFAEHFCCIFDLNEKESGPFYRACTNVLQIMLDDHSHWLQPVYFALLQIYLKTMSGKQKNYTPQQLLESLTERQIWTLRHLYAFHHLSQTRGWQRRLSRFSDENISHLKQKHRQSSLLRFHLLFQILDHLQC